MLGFDPLEVNGMDNRPNLPGSLTGAEKIVLDLGFNGGEAISIDQTQVAKKDSHKDGAPQELVNGNLGGNVFGLGTLDLAVEPVVKIVARGSMVDESKHGERDETLPVERTAAKKDL